MTKVQLQGDKSETNDALEAKMEFSNPEKKYERFFNSQLTCILMSSFAIDIGDDVVLGDMINCLLEDLRPLAPDDFELMSKFRYTPKRRSEQNFNGQFRIFICNISEVVMHIIDFKEKFSEESPYRYKVERATEIINKFAKNIQNHFLDNKGNRRNEAIRRIDELVKHSLKTLIEITDNVQRVEEYEPMDLLFGPMLAILPESEKIKLEDSIKKFDFENIGLEYKKLKYNR